VSNEHAHRLTFCIQGVFEVLADLEMQHFLLRYVNALAGFWIPRLSRLSCLQPEIAETPYLYFFPVHEGLFYAVEHGIDNYLRLASRKPFDFFRDLLDKN